jgi:hypothetical protein
MRETEFESRTTPSKAKTITTQHLARLEVRTAVAARLGCGNTTHTNTTTAITDSNKHNFRDLGVSW